MINIHTHKFDNKEGVIEIVNCYPWQESIYWHQFYSIGIHPWYLRQDKLREDLITIEKQIQTTNCLAIGECGLDKNSKLSSTVQLVVFRAQLALAQKYKKPVIIHCVGYYNELLLLIDQMKITIPIIIHGYVKNKHLAYQLLKKGCFLSFGEALLESQKLEEVVKTLPEDRLFLETDDSDCDLFEIYFKVASIKNCSVKKIQERINYNFEKVFNLSNI